jgi:hypothetical protein
MLALYQIVKIHSCQIRNLVIKLMYLMVFLESICTPKLSIVETAKTLSGELFFWFYLGQDQENNH